MPYKDFKDYIEKRSVAEIMDDYSEQQDEWKTLSVVKNGQDLYLKNKESSNTILKNKET